MDTIRNLSLKSSTIDLRPATLQHAVGGGGYLSVTEGVSGGFTIANGTLIENATGGGGSDRITGNWATNVLIGNGGNDVLNGLSGADRIVGGMGADTLIGGNGADDFVYTAVNHSNNQFDVIKDFIHGVDDIDVAAIDANGAAAGNAAFNFRGNSAFTGTGAEVRWMQHAAANITNVLFDIDGNQVADMTIRLTGLITLDTGDFML